MNDTEVSQIRDIWNLSSENKWRLYRYWIFQYCNIIHRKIDQNEEEFKNACKAHLEIQMQEDKDIMKHATVIGMTTTCAAKYQPVLKELGPRIIVVEEAAEVLEAHVITTLSKQCEHLILIGDHQQLKPNPTVYKLAQNFNLDLSLFERMIKNKLEYNCLQQTASHASRNSKNHENYISKFVESRNCSYI
ncbi:NFX1-type zinc finger-containing protein 1 [Mytilus edulis]|uniref:NFX1-type zinc finger-containing protein 1 n=1 Tax=Mytilus edulis TaxID=6550 RepID=A0A8S3TW87_MYTED|nr:NFX1-type zinc finger-containing protein 1 [Mytilus edulis]